MVQTLIRLGYVRLRNHDPERTHVTVAVRGSSWKHPEQLLHAYAVERPHPCNLTLDGGETISSKDLRIKCSGSEFMLRKKQHVSASKLTVGCETGYASISPNSVSTLRLRGCYGSSKGRCLIRVLHLDRGSFPVNFRLKRLLWNVEVHFDCAGSHKVCVYVLASLWAPAFFL